MKNKLMALMVAVVGMLVAWAETPTVTDVTAKQRYPWNGLVDISCNVSGVDSAGDRYQFVIVAVDKDSGKEYTASHFSVVQDGENDSDYIVFEDGAYKLLWDARTDLGQVVCDRMTVRVTLGAIALSSGKVQLWEGGPYWADTNIGAERPWDDGLFFWWGDTKGHRASADGTFDFNFDSRNSTIYTYGKTVSNLQSAGWVTSDGVLAPRRDAAHVKWGGGWRMPTAQELSDLYNRCVWSYTKMNGVQGLLVRGRGEYASNSIFLPCAGDGSGESWCDVGVGGFYRSSSICSNSYYAYEFGFASGYVFWCGMREFNRFRGCSIRPVQGVSK